MSTSNSGRSIKQYSMISRFSTVISHFQLTLSKEVKDIRRTVSIDYCIPCGDQNGKLIGAVGFHMCIKGVQ